MWGRPVIKEITAQQAQQMLEGGDAVLIDVREPVEYHEIRATGASLIPLGAFQSRVNELPKDKDVLLICRSGGRSAQATLIAQQAGYERVYNVAGGTMAWSSAKLPTEQG